MRLFQRTTVALLLVWMIAVTGCSEPDATTDDTPKAETAMTAVNTSCPIMGGKVTDEGGRTEWNGQTIGFCCPDCISEWDALSGEEKASKLSKAGESGSDQDHGNHVEHGPDHNEG